VNDLIIHGGTVVDGTGAPGSAADVLVLEGMVASIQPPGTLRDGVAAGVPRIDADGRVVCPGFIDLHSHGDLILALEDEELRRRLILGRVAQGITTEIVGNCGLGPAPVVAAHEAALRGVLAWMTPVDRPWPWRGIGEYLDHLERIGVPINVGTLVAHGALRIAQEGLSRDLSSKIQVTAMRNALDDALSQGAFGMSVGLIYPPGSFTPSEDIEPLAEVLSGYGALLTAHVRGSSETLLDAVEEILTWGRRTGVRIHHSHNEAVGPDHWAKIPLVLEREERARRSGVRVTFDMFPYTAAATTMAAIFPPWALEGGLAALVARLRDPAARARIGADVAGVTPSWPPWGEGGWAHNLVSAVGWERITIGTIGGDSSRGAEGLNLGSLARREGKAPFEAIADLMVAAEGRVSQIIHGVSGEDGDDPGLVSLMVDQHAAICTDANDTGRGLPHPAAYGAFPRILGHFVRERQVMPLEEAIRKMTSYPASILGLADRGVLRTAAAADIVIFDPATVGSAATFQDPRRPASGIDSVIVNGEVVCQRGRLQGGRPGVVLRREK